MLIWCCTAIQVYHCLLISGELMQFMPEVRNVFHAHQVLSYSCNPIHTHTHSITFILLQQRYVYYIPPGISMLSFSEAAVAKMMTREDKTPNWYFDVVIYLHRSSYYRIINCYCYNYYCRYLDMKAIQKYLVVKDGNSIYILVVEYNHHTS